MREPRLRLLIVPALVAALCVAVGTAVGSSGFKFTFQGQSHHVQPGSAWAFLIQASQNGRSWQGVVTLAVQTAKGKTVDNVGRFPVNGTLLQGYLWNPHDHGSFVFKATFRQGGRVVGQTAYAVTLT
jgi:hypothetical protein